MRLGQLSGVIGLRIEPSEWLLCLEYEQSCSVNSVECLEQLQDIHLLKTDVVHGVC